MADLTANDVTIGVVHKDLSHNQKMFLVTLSVGDGAKTVPVGGIPLPSFKNLWMWHQVIEMIITSKGGSGYAFDYDRANHKLLVRFFDYDAIADGPAVAFTGALPATVLRAMVYGK